MFESGSVWSTACCAYRRCRKVFFDYWTDWLSRLRRFVNNYKILILLGGTAGILLGYTIFSFASDKKTEIQVLLIEKESVSEEIRDLEYLSRKLIFDDVDFIHDRYKNGIKYIEFDLKTIAAYFKDVEKSVVEKWPGGGRPDILAKIGHINYMIDNDKIVEYLIYLQSGDADFGNRVNVFTDILQEARSVIEAEIGQRQVLLKDYPDLSSKNFASLANNVKLFNFMMTFSIYLSITSIFGLIVALSQMPKIRIARFV